MATKQKNLSAVASKKYDFASKCRLDLVVSEWNHEITAALAEGALSTLQKLGVQKNNIRIHKVPGSFELPLAAKLVLKYSGSDAVICLGCVIKGETKHFEYISSCVAHGIMNVGLESGIPVVFGVLTTNNILQAKERSGGKHGNKGVEAAFTAMEMIALKRTI
jgi:6,7-dimethyl-8-ribityllumazine synthase